MKKILIAFLFSILILPTRVQASEIYGVLTQEKIYENQSFIIDWFIDTKDQSINSLDLSFKFTPDFIKLTQPTTGNSIINLWVSAPHLVDSQNFSLTGGITSGLSGSKLPIFRTEFTALKPGVGYINLNPNSTILINDGKGTADTITYKKMEVFIEPKSKLASVITSKTHPNQSKWYKIRDVEIEFTPEANESYAYSFSSNPEILPPFTATKTDGKFSFNNLPDGIYYFKLNAIKTGGDWEQKYTYRVQIDSTPPESFTPIIGQDQDSFGKKQFISFSTQDKLSGLDKFKIKIGELGKFHIAQNPQILTRPLIGDNLYIEAWDNAGNVTQTQIKYKGYIPFKVFIGIIIFLSLIILLLYRYKLTKK